MSILIAIVVLIVLAIIDQNEIDKKRKPIVIGYRPVTGEPIYNKVSDEKPIRYDIHTGAPIYASDLENKTVPKVKTEEDKARIKNSVLMITGAVLIVFASIIFLATSWESLEGIVKTLILIGLQIVFFVFSYICKESLDIPKTSKIFKYLGLIFTPIVLISLSTFELVGDYLSVNGEGAILYFGLAFILTDVIYKMINIREKDCNIAWMSYVAELLGILLVFSHFIDFENWAFLIVAIYHLFFYILISKNVVSKDYYLKINHIMSYVIIGILLIFLTVEGPTYSTNLAVLTFVFYYFLNYQNSDNDMKQRRYVVYFLALYAISLSILSNIDTPPYFIYNIALLPLLLLTKIAKKDTLKNLICYGVLTISILITLRSIGDIIFDAIIPIKEEIYYLLTFITAFILYVLTYLLSKKGFTKIAAYSAFTLIFMQIFRMVDLAEFNKYILLVTVVLVYFLEVLFDKLKDTASDYFIVAAIMIESIVLFGNYAVLIPLVFMIAYTKLEKKSEALLILPLLMSLSIFTMEVTLWSRIVGYILIIIYSLLSLSKKEFNIYTVISFISIFVGSAALEFSGIVFSGILLLWSVAHLYLEKESLFFKFATITSLLLLYINIIKELDLDLSSLYLIGFYLYLLGITQYLFKKNAKDLKPLDCIGIGILTIISLIICSTATDAVIIIFTLLVICILAFLMKWDHILYTSLICMIINIIFLTFEYWSQIPWYVYILIVGLALIVFAMLDEKRKMNKKKKEQEQIDTK